MNADYKVAQLSTAKCIMTENSLLDHTGLFSYRYEYKLRIANHDYREIPRDLVLSFPLRQNPAIFSS